MKVYCIESGLDKCHNSGRKVKTPIPFETYTILKVHQGLGNRVKEIFYEIEELTPKVGYEAYLFIPLSEIDETELTNYSIKENIFYEKEIKDLVL